MAGNKLPALKRGGGGETTNLLSSNTPGFSLHAGAACAHQLPPQHRIGSLGGGASSYGGGNAPTATANNFTAQLLADNGNNTTGAVLGNFMQQLSQQSQQPPHQAFANGMGDASIVKEKSFRCVMVVRMQIMLKTCRVHVYSGL